MAIALAWGALAGCSGLRLRSIESIPVSDPAATNETRALFMNLWLQGRSRRTLFGHQDDLAYGVHWRREPGRSDVLETAGSYPAVYGWDIGGLELGNEVNLDGVAFSDMRRWIREGYERGGVITISWHMYNPATGGNFSDRTPALGTLLPGRSNHDWYRTALDRVARFFQSLTSDGTPWNPQPHWIPVVFRPFHEHNSGQFWWGRGNALDQEYVILWRFTTDYLQRDSGVHHLLYAFSPSHLGLNSTNRSSLDNSYLYAYPGDEHVDVLGLDYYNDFDTAVARDDYRKAVGAMLAAAYDHFKIPAITETGMRRSMNSRWWTGFLLPMVRNSARTPSHGLPAWVLVWRNAAEDHHFAPYRGHASEGDFRRFRDTSTMVFEDEISRSLYLWP